MDGLVLVEIVQIKGKGTTWSLLCPPEVPVHRGRMFTRRKKERHEDGRKWHSLQSQTPDKLVEEMRLAYIEQEEKRSRPR